ncbi:MAG TPA: hypothetical protein VGH44_05915 [Candidatus Saccharimonadia bacterium]|jgi:hypothetical protein
MKRFLLVVIPAIGYTTIILLWPNTDTLPAQIMLAVAAFTLLLPVAFHLPEAAKGSSEAIRDALSAQVGGFLLAIIAGGIMIAVTRPSYAAWGGVASSLAFANFSTYAVRNLNAYRNRGNA